MVPDNSLGAALKYGRRAQEELDRAVALDPKSSDVDLSRGIGKYYLPAMFGGGGGLGGLGGGGAMPDLGGLGGAGGALPGLGGAPFNLPPGFDKFSKK